MPTWLLFAHKGGVVIGLSGCGRERGRCAAGGMGVIGCNDVSDSQSE